MREKKQRKADQQSSLKRRNAIRIKMGKPVYFTLTNCTKKLNGIQNRYNYKSNMHGLLFIGTRFCNVKYQASIMTKCNFRDSELIGVDFFNCNMKGVSFKNAHLSDVVFYNCNLQEANFSGATFSKVAFICTNTTTPVYLDVADSGIIVYSSYSKVAIPLSSETSLLELSNNLSIFTARVLHVNKNKLNHWALELLRNEFGIDGIVRLVEILSQKNDWKNLYTIYSYKKVLEHI